MLWLKEFQRYDFLLVVLCGSQRIGSGNRNVVLFHEKELSLSSCQLLNVTIVRSDSAAVVPERNLEIVTLKFPEPGHDCKS